MAHILSGRYKIKRNNIETDWWDDYGVGVSTGSDGFLALPKPKTPFIKDWQDENGIEVDLIGRRFQQREVSFECFMIGQNKEDFWTKYQNFFDAISADGTFDLYVNRFARNFEKLWLKDFDFRDNLEKWGDNGKIFIRFKLLISETVPSGIVVIPGEGGGGTDPGIPSTEIMLLDPTSGSVLVDNSGTVYTI